jgi:hypothetical protein
MLQQVRARWRTYRERRREAEIQNALRRQAAKHHVDAPPKIESGGVPTPPGDAGSAGL